MGPTSVAQSISFDEYWRDGSGWNNWINGHGRERNFFFTTKKKKKRCVSRCALTAGCVSHGRDVSRNEAQRIIMKPDPVCNVTNILPNFPPSLLAFKVKTLPPLYEPLPTNIADIIIKSNVHTDMLQPFFTWHVLSILSLSPLTPAIVTP